MYKSLLFGGITFTIVNNFLQNKKKAKMASPHVQMEKVPASVRKMMEENPDNLPRLPIPSLDDTLTRYLSSVRPHVDDAEYARQEKLCEEFKTGPGAELQKELIAMDSQEGYPYSFIEQHWDEMYQGLRCPAPINISPCFGIADEKDASKQAQVPRAARFVHGFARWANKILDGNFEADKGLCSYAYPKHFGSAKVPKKGMDHLAMYGTAATDVVVICNGKLYSLQVLDGGALMSIEDIEAKMNEIIKTSVTSNEGAQIPVQMMTAVDRDAWAEVRDSLYAENENVFKTIDSALIVVCLDFAPKKATDLTERTSNMLIPTTNMANRWWDKQQLVVDGSGAMGITFEHSYGDGTNWGRLIREVMMESDGLPPVDVPLPTMPVMKDPKSAKLLTFKGADKVKAQVDAATADYTKAASDLEVSVLDFKDFGKGSIKTWNCSPDAVLQMAFQAAYFDLNKKMPPVYEAGATRKFLHGRTETIRSATTDTTAFVKAFDESKSSIFSSNKAEVLGLMQAAAKTHGGLAKAAASGSGIDRHLTALQKNCAKAGKPTPALFDDPTFNMSRNWCLSTSNGSQPYISLFGFGAVIPEGYGIGYLINNNDCNVVVTSYKSCPSTSSAKMATTIGDTLRSMKKLTE